MIRVKKIIVVVIVIAMILSLGLSYSYGSETAIHDRDRIQSNIKDADQLQARSELNKRLHIDGEAYLQMMEMVRERIENRFTDLENHWSKEEILNGFDWGLINGYPDGTFRPNNTISGTEGVLLLARLVNCMTEWNGIVDGDAKLDYSLIPNWARIQISEKIPLSIAFRNQTYGSEPLTRLEFALMLARTLGIQSEELTDEITVFLDDDLLSEEELGFIYRLRVLGILKGNNGNFMPHNRLTRGEAVAMMMRAMNMFGITPDEYNYSENELTVNLYENPSTGYSWHWKFSDGTILKLVEDDFIQSSQSTGMVGSGGTRRFVFQTLKAGMENISFYYYRSWEDVSTAVDVRIIDVKVGSDLKIIEVK